MNVLVKILLGLLLIAGFCIVMDVITFVYEYIWILPIIIGAIFLIRFILRPDFREKVFSFIIGKNRGKKAPSVIPMSRNRLTHTDSIDAFKELVDLAMADGEISKSERMVLTRKGVDMGITPNEAEMLINTRIEELNNKI